MNAPMQIRAATPDDADAVLAIYAPVVRETTISFELEPPTREVMRQRIASTLQTLPWLVGVDADGGVNGYVYAGKHRDPGAYRWSVNVSVYIRDDCRGQGVGKRLYGALFDELQRLGYHQAYAGIALPNRASVALHRALGFRRIGTYRNVGYKFDAWRDVAWWQRALCPPPAAPAAPRAFGAA